MSIDTIVSHLSQARLLLPAEEETLRETKEPKAFLQTLVGIYLRLSPIDD